MYGEVEGYRIAIQAPLKTKKTYSPSKFIPNKLTAFLELFHLIDNLTYVFLLLFRNLNYNDSYVWLSINH